MGKSVTAVDSLQHAVVFVGTNDRNNRQKNSEPEVQVSLELRSLINWNSSGRWPSRLRTVLLEDQFGSSESRNRPSGT
jgi:hypothetical protein